MDLAAVIGLGNPGNEYENTRHNVGYRVVDELARRWRTGVWQYRYRCLIAHRVRGTSIWLAKPQTFMNNSGDGVGALLRGETLEPAQCLIIVDDVELPLGSLRVRERGGAGTHNGMRSVVGAIGENFPRLRLGIRGENPWRDLADYVLAPFELDESPFVGEMIGRAADCVDAVVREGFARAASRFNARPAEADSVSDP